MLLYKREDSSCVQNVYTYIIIIIIIIITTYHKEYWLY